MLVARRLIAAAASAAPQVITVPVITQGVPSNLTLPVISGTAQVGNVLTVTNGTWTNEPTSYTYAWQKDVSGTWTTCTGTGAETSSYTIASSDNTYTLRCVVTAVNGSGSSTPADTAATSAVTTSTGGTPAFVQEIQQFNLVSGPSSPFQDVVTVAKSVSTGSLLVIGWENGNEITNNLVSVSDSKSNSWQIPTVASVPALSDDSGTTTFAGGIAVGYISSALTTSDTITLTWTTSDYNYKLGSIEQFSGFASSYSVDKVTVINATYGSTISCAITPTNANELVVTFLYQQEGTAPPVYTVGSGSGFTHISANTGTSLRQIDALYSVPSSGGSAVNPSGTYASNTTWRGVSVALIT